MAYAWVLGSGGMLGSALTRELKRQGVDVYQYNQRFDWKNTEQIALQFKLALQEFMSRLSPGDRWEIYWAAGLGAMGSKKADLDLETAALKVFLNLLRERFMLFKAPGLIGFASSAGALYTASSGFEITELSAITALTDYAKAKLTQEQLLQDFLSKMTDVGLLIARFSTLYGPGQSLGKKQGLLTHIARCVIRRQPVSIFVPLDTSRDYLFVDDAACEFIGSLRALRGLGPKSQIRIIASEQSATISEIISVFNRLVKKRVRLVCSQNNLTDLYASRVAYRSIYSKQNVMKQQYALHEGAAILLNAERAAYLEGCARRE